MDEKETKATTAEAAKEKKAADKEAAKAKKEAEKAEKAAEKAKKKLQKEREKKEKYDVAAGGMSKAEEAREKRKASMQKTSEKEKEKKRKKAALTKKQKLIRILTPICVVVLAAVFFFLGYFGVYDRASTAVKLADGSKVSVAEYEYYYRSMYNYYYSYSYQYETYYSSYYGTGAGASITGFDYAKTPENQEYTITDEDGNLGVDEEYITGDTATWADYFTQAATETSQLYTALYQEALEAGYTMSDSENQELEDFIADIQTSADEEGYSLYAYLRANYGRGMTESLLREIYIKQTIATDYLADKEEQYDDAVTDDAINAEYEENMQDYTSVSLRYFTFDSSTLDEDLSDEPTDEELEAANEELAAKADAFLEEATTDNFTDLAYNSVAEAYQSYYEDNDAYTTMEDTTYSDLSSSVSEDAAEWAFSAKVGDKKVIPVENDGTCNTYYVFLVTEAPTRDTSYPVSVRHILISGTEEDTSEDTDTDTDSDSDDSTTRTFAEAKTLAELYLEEWKAGDATEDSFAELASSVSEDSGSAEDGGLYEDITPDSDYVENFLNWCFEDGRKVGDTGIVQTKYGYHIMYCSEVATEPAWKIAVRETLGEESFQEYYDSFTEGETYAITSQSHASAVVNREEKFAETCIANASVSS